MKNLPGVCSFSPSAINGMENRLEYLCILVRVIFKFYQLNPQKFVYSLLVAIFFFSCWVIREVQYLPDCASFGVIWVDAARGERCFSLAVVAVELHKALAASATVKVPWALFCWAFDLCWQPHLPGWFIIPFLSQTFRQRKLLQQWAPTMLGGALPFGLRSPKTGISFPSGGVPTGAWQ